MFQYGFHHWLEQLGRIETTTQTAAENGERIAKNILDSG